MATLVGARPLMLPLQQTDICIATQKRNINEWLQLPWQFNGFFLLLEEELVSIKVLQKLYENKYIIIAGQKV